MSAKQAIGSFIGKVGRLPGIKQVLFHPRVRTTIQTWPGLHTVYGKGWDLLHPFDRAHGTDTSGYVGTEDLPSSPFDASRQHVYGGSQPGIIRSALGMLPSLEGFTFVDLGCGKGRPLLVATEFPFRDLVGVELSSQLAADAQKNAAVFRQRFPDRVPVRVENGDASIFAYPPGHLVVFLYNPFGAEVIAKVVAGIEAALAAEERTIFVVYYNPVHGVCMDASPVLKRYFAATLPYADDELGFGPDEEDSVVIWQPISAGRPLAGADARIVVTRPGYRAELASS